MPSCTSFECGHVAWKSGETPRHQLCEHSARLAIERAAEIERLNAELAKHTELWHKALKRSDWFEFQRDDLADQVAAMMEENAKDLAGMRDMQAKFIKSDHERRDLVCEVERLKDQLKAMADFFAHYTCLNECGQDEIEDEAERLIASASKTLEAKQ